MNSIGIVGCGSIGRSILKAVDEGRLKVRVAGVTSRTEATARDFLATLKSPPPFLSQPELIDACDLVIETAGGHVVPELARATFAAVTTWSMPIGADWLPPALRRLALLRLKLAIWR